MWSILLIFPVVIAAWLLGSLSGVLTGAGLSVGITVVSYLIESSIAVSLRFFIGGLASLCFIGFVIGRLIELNTKILDLSIKDGLTGSYNRRYFDEQIQFEVIRSKRYKRPISLLLIDIDWFKRYNDHHGHQRGDDLLKLLVTLVSKNIRTVDGLFRYGGEEFAVLLPETGKDNAVFVAAKLNKLIEQESFTGEEDSQPEKKVTISIGVASFPEDAFDDSQLVRAADKALYQAKESGRNRVCAADPAK